MKPSRMPLEVYNLLVASAAQTLVVRRWTVIFHSYSEYYWAVGPTGRVLTAKCRNRRWTVSEGNQVLAKFWGRAEVKKFIEMELIGNAVTVDDFLPA